MDNKEQNKEQELNDLNISNFSSSSSSNSPRKKNPPLDLNAALLIQSQAISVQEPNNKRTLLASLSTSSNVAYNSQNTPIVSSNNFNYNQQVPRQPSYRSNIAYWSDNYAANNNNFNISVDYIDCVSNNDLGDSFVPSGLTKNYQNNYIMKALPGVCGKKHLRFHRNRVDPNEATKEHRASLASVPEDNVVSKDKILRRTSSISYDEQQQLRDAAGPSQSTSSLLYPISVSEVKKQTYFIGQFSEDSLLGQEELYRYFPNGKVSIFVCTWNQNRKRAPMNLNDLLLPDQLVYMPDIYAIGIQESFSSQQDYLKDWEIELQTTLGPRHVLLHSCSLGTLHLSVFVRRDLIWHCSIPEESAYNSRSMPTNMIKTKGAVSIAFRFFGTSFMFTNCHFPANENKLKDRIDEYQRIINSIDLPKDLKLLKPRYLSNDSTARFDCVFFMGDLNFRLEQRTFDETIQILEDIFTQKEPSYEVLTQHDELLKVMESNQAFHGFDECQIKFPPTYKFLAKTNKYDKQTKRVPSYTDRILFRSKRQRHIQCLIYDWLPQLVSSDHKPVYCLFDVLVRPGREQKGLVASLNAGLFQRTVYLEALKRRAEDQNSMQGDDGQEGGSFICSIS